MAATTVHVRLDGKVKQKAAKTLARMGLSVSDAVRMLLTHVAEDETLPFTVKEHRNSKKGAAARRKIKVPNAETIAAMEASRRGEGRRFSSAAALIKHLGI